MVIVRIKNKIVRAITTLSIYIRVIKKELNKQVSRMAKREETIELEQALKDDTKERYRYGCEEITIGFKHMGLGNEIVDFMTMDSYGVMRCYEIKISLSDLKSKAKKSWYGNYNYLVISDDLYAELGKEYLMEQIPSSVGILVGKELKEVSESNYIEIKQEQKQMLQESMVRSLYWKLMNSYNSTDIVYMRNLTNKVKRLQKTVDKLKNRAEEAEYLLAKEWGYEVPSRYKDPIEEDYVEIS